MEDFFFRFGFSVFLVFIVDVLLTIKYLFSEESVFDRDSKGMHAAYFVACFVGFGVGVLASPF